MALRLSGAVSRALEEIAASAPRIAQAEAAQMIVWRGGKTSRQPLLLRSALTGDEAADFPKHTYREMYEDAESNLEAQVPAMLESVRGGMQAIPSARANMGCGIFASFFGLTQTLYDDKMPWLREHLSKKFLLGLSAKDLVPGEPFRRGISHMALLAEAFAGTGARVFPMDLQGPTDLAHLVMGDAFFFDICDDPEFVRRLLGLCAEAAKKGFGMCLDAVPGSEISVSHYNDVTLPRSMGGVKTSEDTTTLLSGEHIRDLSMPLTARMLASCGGGYVHFCGSNPHLLEAALGEKNVIGINLGNPEKHDMEDVLRRCAQAGKVYYGSVPRRPGEDWEPYFSRLLRAAARDGRKWLLLAASCGPGERDAVEDAWDRANAVADAAFV